MLDRIREDFEAKDFPAIGLGIVMLLAGSSKFFILQYWTGYEPQMVVQLLPLTAEQMVLIGGVFESVLGMMLVARKKVETVSLITASWLAIITLQLVRLQIWDLAIRDLGLTFYALTVSRSPKT